jgi:2-iminobutanoate/2-iminopropanoate deaminase
MTIPSVHSKEPVSRLTPVTSDKAPRGTGGYTPALRAGDFVYVSGQGPLDPQTLEVCGSTVAEQTTRTLRNLLELVRAAGGDAASIIRCTCYLHAIDSFDEFNAAYETFFTHEPRPTRTTIGCELAGILVEIDCVAYVPLPADG